MNLLNKAKRYVTQKVNHVVFTQKQKLDIKVSQLREDLILKYMMPQLLQYVREVIISKGLNPDVMPDPKVVAVNDRPTTRNKSTNFCLNAPSWLKESFKDESKHIINKIKSLKTEVSNAVVTEPVVETPVVADNDGLVDINMENLFQINTEKTIKDKPIKPVRSRKKVVVVKEDLINEVSKKAVTKKSNSNK